MTKAELKRRALSPTEAASALGISRSVFYSDVVHELRTVRLGRRRLIPVAELERWLDRRAALWGE